MAWMVIRHRNEQTALAKEKTYPFLRSSQWSSETSSTKKRVRVLMVEKWMNLLGWKGARLDEMAAEERLVGGDVVAMEAETPLPPSYATYRSGRSR